jgi:hypothetical protein
MSLLWRYRILKEIVILLGLFEYLGLGGSLYFLGAERFQETLWFLLLMGISYYISSKLGYRVSEILVQLQIQKAKETDLSAPVR